MNLKFYSGSVGAAALAVLLAGCNSSGSSGGTGAVASGAVLKSVTYGRLVDVYSYRRIDARRADRRDTLNRVPVLVAENVVIRPTVETQDLFDPTGGVRADAYYRFMPFDVDVGHEELLILWDDQIPPEKDSFDKALVLAMENLPEVVGSFRDQNTSVRPIPVVPRNAALKLTFDQDLGVAPAFFGVNPNAVQVLEFITDPTNKSRPNSFRPVMTRILGKGHEIIIDTSLVGGEANGGLTSAGLPASIDNVTANLRIALPTAGIVSKQLKFAEDPIAELNGVDSSGESAVIRDFRSGNLADGKVGTLADVEKPMVVAHVAMGIIDVDKDQRIVTLNKRNADIVVRGRVPFVDGALDEVNDLASGPEMLPTTEALRSGDVLMQTVLSPAGEFVRLRAEVLMNLDVGNKKGQAGFPSIGSARSGVFPRDGGQESTVRVLVGNLTGVDSQGNSVMFQASDLPLGQDCDVKVHYYEHVEGNLKLGTDKVSDSDRRASFLVLDPLPPKLDPNRQPVPAGTMVDPLASVSLRFSEPMDLLTVRPLQNYILSNWTINSGNLLEMLEESKPSSLAILAVKLLDQTGDGTLLRLNPLLGHFHEKDSVKDPLGEVYWFHMILGQEGVADLAGNIVDLYDRSANATRSFSVRYQLDPAAKTNAVGHRIFRFENPDEDGTTLGSLDLWGQFQLIEGELRGEETKRFSAIADNQILSGILLYDRGECSLPGDPTKTPPVPPSYAPFPPGYPPGVRYMCPSMVAVQFPPIPLAFQPPNAPQIRGGVSEPHNQRGSRLQMTYREDDFGIGFKQTSKQMIDIEQMHWAPFNDEPVRFDTFDRYSLRLAHCDWRPDIAYVLSAGPPPIYCIPDCYSLRGGLRDIFDDNVLQGSQYVRVVKDAVYEINPNDAFRAPSTGTKFVPYPKFEKTYTWRDSRLATWDQVKDVAIGFGGAHQANADPAIADTTTSVSAPFVPDMPPDNIAALHTSTPYVYDEGDFLGFRNRDHDPMALPLLMDFSVFPDGPDNGGYALGTNQFHIALSGPCWSPISPGGYYNMTSVPGCAPLRWPYFRVHATGGIDPITLESKLIDPENTTTAQPSVIKDIFWGDPIQALWTAPPQDDHVHWGQVDFVRRVSLATFGFWDTLKPNQHDFNSTTNGYTTNWPGKGDAGGFPNLTGLGTGIKDFVSFMDPPISRQPIGTAVRIEFRGATSFDNDTVLFDQSIDTAAGTTSANIIQKRGNILNPLYAFEAYRYASPNPGPTTYNWVTVQSGPRVNAKGLTEYVPEEKLDAIRLKSNALLPRYLNFRVIFENNLDANPPITPSLKSFAVAYRIAN